MALRPVWRTDDELQIGLDPDRAVVVDGIDERTARVLLGLDGSRTEAEVLAAAGGDGVDADALGGLLADLRGAGVLADAGGGPAARRAEPAPPPGSAAAARAFGAAAAAGRLGPDLASLSLLATVRTPLEVLRRRRAATVVLHRADRVGVSVATLLAAAGVGRVHVADRGPVRPGDVAPGGFPAADVERPRSGAAVEALRRVAPEVQAGAPAPGRRPDLVVLPSVEPADAALRGILAGGRVPHLVVGVRETTAVVGPLVLPGVSSCLRCADLHRTDRDPAWPVVAAQLAGVRRRRDEPCDVVLATVAAGVAALQCLAHLDGRPVASAGASLELALPDWRLRRRSWPPHRRCDCGAAR
jgi:ThiF family